jgi:hypothetical protein
VNKESVSFRQACDFFGRPRVHGGGRQGKPKKRPKKKRTGIILERKKRTGIILDVWPEAQKDRHNR